MLNSLKKYMYATAVCILFLIVFSCKESEDDYTVRFGVFTDAHLSLMHDSEFRLGAFIDEMNEEKPDFII